VNFFFKLVDLLDFKQLWRLFEHTQMFRIHLFLRQAIQIRSMFWYSSKTRMMRVKTNKICFLPRIYDSLQYMQKNYHSYIKLISHENKTHKYIAKSILYYKQQWNEIELNAIVRSRDVGWVFWWRRIDVCIKLFLKLRVSYDFENVK